MSTHFLAHRTIVLLVALLVFSTCTSTPTGPDALPQAGTSEAEAGEPGTGRLTFDSDRTGNHEIYALDLETLESHPLTADPTLDSWWARTSPDRSRILFYRTPRGVRDTDYTQTSLWIMDADGGNQRVLRPRGTDGWELQGHADWSPDGRELVMMGGRRANGVQHVPLLHLILCVDGAVDRLPGCEEDRTA